MNHQSTIRGEVRCYPGLRSLSPWETEDIFCVVEEIQKIPIVQAEEKKEILNENSRKTVE